MASAPLGATRHKSSQVKNIQIWNDAAPMTHIYYSANCCSVHRCFLYARSRIIVPPARFKPWIMSIRSSSFDQSIKNSHQKIADANNSYLTVHLCICVFVTYISRRILVKFAFSNGIGLWLLRLAVATCWESDDPPISCAGHPILLRSAAPSAYKEVDRARRLLSCYALATKYDSTTIRRPFDCLSKVIKVTVT